MKRTLLFLLIAAFVGMLAGELLYRSSWRLHATKVEVADGRVEQEYELLAAQFGDEQRFQNALRRSGLSGAQLRQKVRAQLRELAWFEQRVAEAPDAKLDEFQRYYQTHRAAFVRPPRMSANQLFLAAHDQTPPETIEAKRRLIDALAARIKHGETLAALAAQYSEDEASKGRGGNLNYFSAARMPEDFFSAVAKLRPGEISKPFQTSLGFHIVQQTDFRPAADMSFEEARPEIETILANEKRSAIVAAAVASRTRR